MSYTNGLDKPSDYFETKLYTGNGSTQSITGLDFQPNMNWIKTRTRSGYNHCLVDSVRGVTKVLRPNLAYAEDTYTDALTSFNSDGFSLGADNNGEQNKNGDSYVSWNWKAGTSVSGNTGGSGTAKTYTGSVNTDAGFSIIRYIGNGTAGHTIPHHLGTTPTWFICRTISAAKEWDVYHHKLASSPESDYIVLNTTAAAAGATDAADKWNDTAPTSSVVTLGDSSQINTNDGTCIMYAFSEKQGYSKFGSYTGNGNADGAFVYTGFKPAYVMIKLTSGAGEDWKIYDDKRLGYNAANKSLAANTNVADSNSNISIDILSSGFKNRNTSGALNSSGATYIFMAFASNPFVTSTGVPATAR